MEHKLSQFNFYYKRKEDENIIYNTFSKAVVVLSDAESQELESLSFSDVIVKNQLIDNGILVEKAFDEIGFLKYWHYKTKFSNSALYLTIAPTLDCNFACPYCYENRRPGKMSEKTQDAIMGFVRKAIQDGAKSIDITWYGGEPLLCMDVVESLSRRILQVTKENSCYLKMHMVTNGNLLSERIVEILDEIGVTRVQITLDGLQENHDKRRPLRNGEGTFARIMKNLELFANSPIEVLVRMNIDNQNYMDFASLKEQIAQLDNPNIEVYPSPVEDINKDTINTVSDFMTTEEFEAFAIATSDESGILPDDFDVLDNRFCFCTAETENCYVVDEVGDFYKCWDEVGRKEYCCFNVLDTEHVNYSHIAKYLADDPFSDKKCGRCVFLPLCFGGCKFQKAHLDKSVCGFTAEIFKKYVEAAFFAGRGGENDEGNSESEDDA